MLSKAALAEVVALNGPRPFIFTLQLLSAWAVIAAVVAFALHMSTIWATILAIFVVATRHNLLGLLVHEQAHLLGYKGKFGDLLVNLFAAYPMLVLTVEGYAQVHLAHHRDYFSEKDPDFLRKSGEEWSIPKSPRKLALLFLTDVLALNTLKLIRGKKRSDAQFAFARRFRIPKWVRPAYYIVVASVLTLTESWALFLVYWLLPLLTVSPALVRWGAICEHKYNLPGASVAESTPLIILQWWERLLIPNLNFGMHPYHHFFPGVSFSKLPRVHQIFCGEGLVNHDNIFFGNASFLRFITTPGVAAAAEAGQPSVTQ
jgi:fatty acid desaturase